MTTIVKKDATVRARVPKHIADSCLESALALGFFNVADYVRLALVEKLARDTGKSYQDILKGN